jgi:hypothetical protein
VGTIRRRGNVVSGSLIAHPGTSRRPVHAKNSSIACRPEPISSEAERARLAVTWAGCSSSRTTVLVEPDRAGSRTPRPVLYHVVHREGHLRVRRVPVLRRVATRSSGMAR